MHPPRLCRLRYYLCCSLVVLVFVLIYFGSIADRLPWESSSGKKGHKTHTWPKIGKSVFRKPSLFSNNPRKMQQGLLSSSEERPSSFKRKDGSLRKDKGLWMEDHFPPRQTLPLESQYKQRESELAKETPAPPLKTQALGFKNKVSPHSEDLWKKKKPSVQKTKNLGLLKEPLESSEIKRMFFRERPSTGLKNNIEPIPRDPWREKPKPSLKSQTPGLKNKLSSSSDSLWKKTQNLWQDNKMVAKSNPGPFSRNKTFRLRDKLSSSSRLPWKEPPPTQGQRQEMTGRYGVLYGKSNNNNTPGRKGTTTAQKARKYQTPDDWLKFFVPRNQQQFSMEYHYRHKARSVCRTPVDMLVMVLSAPKNQLRRQAIRDTWGSVVRNRTWPGPSPQTLPKTLGLVFLLGEEKQLGSNASEALEEESKKYGDVVQWRGLRNTAFNRTMKVLLGLKWVALYCSQVSHVIKAEDDSFVHVPRLLQVLLSKPATSSLIWGFQIEQASSTARGGKNAVSPEAYPFAYFPSYVKGGLYVLPGNAVPRMIATAPYLPYNNREDVHVTGTLALALGLPHEPFTYKEMLIPRDARDPCLFQHAKYGLVRVQIKAPSFVYRIWKRISDPRLCG